MNSTTSVLFATTQATAIVTRPQELSLRIARLKRKIKRTAGMEQDRALAALLGLYRQRAAAFDRGAA